MAFEKPLSRYEFQTTCWWNGRIEDNVVKHPKGEILWKFDYGVVELGPLTSLEGEIVTDQGVYNAEGSADGCGFVLYPVKQIARKGDDFHTHFLREREEEAEEERKRLQNREKRQRKQAKKEKRRKAKAAIPRK